MGMVKKHILWYNIDDDGIVFPFYDPAASTRTQGIQANISYNHQKETRTFIQQETIVKIHYLPAVSAKNKKEYEGSYVLWDLLKQQSER